MAALQPTGQSPTLYQRGSSTAEYTAETPTRTTPIPGPEDINRQVTVEGAVARLSAQLSRLEGVTFQLGIPQESGDGLPPHILEFQTILSDTLPPMLEAAEAVGAGNMNRVKDALDFIQKILHASSQCKKPSPEELGAFVQPLAEIGNEFRDGPGGYADPKNNPLAAHYGMGKSIVEMSYWFQFDSTVVIDGQAQLGPITWAKTMKETFDGYKNSVLIKGKTDESHKTFATACDALATKQIAYIKKYFATKLIWNPKGIDFGDFVPPDATGDAGGATEEKEDIFDVQRKLFDSIDAAISRLEGYAALFAGDGEGPPPFVTEFEGILNEFLPQILERAEALGAEHVVLLRDAMDIFMNFLKAVANSKKAERGDILQVLQPLVEITNQFWNENPPPLHVRGFADDFLAFTKGKKKGRANTKKPNPFKHHYKIIANLLKMCMWVQARLPTVQLTQENAHLVSVLTLQETISSEFSEMELSINACLTLQGVGDDVRTLNREYATLCKKFGQAHMEWFKKFKMAQGLPWDAKGGDLVEQFSG